MGSPICGIRLLFLALLGFVVLCEGEELPTRVVAIKSVVHRRICRALRRGHDLFVLNEFEFDSLLKLSLTEVIPVQAEGFPEKYGE